MNEKIIFEKGNVKAKDKRQMFLFFIHQERLKLNQQRTGKLVQK